MITPATFTRRSARVEAMRLNSVPALEYAAHWLEDHGVASSLDRRAYVLWIATPAGTRTPAGLGQWLSIDVESAGVSVWPNDKFRIEHPQDEETNVAVQLCPKCNGQGTVAKPPWIPGDVHTWNSGDLAPHRCNLCEGRMVIPAEVTE